MSMDGFNQASGFTATWVDHWVVIVVGTLVLIAGTVIITMLTHKIGDGDKTTLVWVLSYFLFVVLVVFLLLGFLNNFWR